MTKTAGKRSSTSRTVKFNSWPLTFETWVIEARFGRGLAYWHDLGYKLHPELIRDFMPVLEQFREAVLNLPASITGPDDLIQTADLQLELERSILDNVSTYTILPKDAYIFAEATRLGVNCLATLDSDWDRADGFIVYRPN